MHADLILTGGRVHPVAPGLPDAEAIAVTRGRIALLGTAREVGELRGPETNVIDLAGGTVLPGFQDAHAHPLHGGLASMRCDLYKTKTSDEHLAEVRRYANKHPKLPWIVGGGWSMDDFAGAMPSRRLLDGAAPGRAIVLWARDGHTMWVSTPALELAGITAATPDPPGGVIDRESNGAPAGTLHELAMKLVERELPPPRRAEWDEALQRMQREYHRFGITAVQEANADPELVDAYLRASFAGTLTLRVEGNLPWDPHQGDQQLEDLVGRRATAQAARVRMRGVKLFQDGVVENQTAALLTPYRDAAGAATDNTGLSIYPPGDLNRIVTLLDREGFQVHIHAIGDRAVREALDAIEQARWVNGARDARHHLAHVQFADPADIARFPELGVVANVTPYWAVRSGYVEELTIPFIDESLRDRVYPFGALAAAGTRLAFGSDWPVSTPDPLAQIEVAVMRQLPGDFGSEPLHADERLDLRRALHAATLGAAFVNELDGETGSLQPGKLADLVVLDGDILSPLGPRPTEARVRFTIVEGEIVYEA